MSEVYLEVGSKKVFACSVDWAGWCRSAKMEDAALEALADYAERYSPSPASMLGLPKEERTRKGISAAVRRGRSEGKWPPRYAARRIAWHVLDHAWEMQDRSD